MGNEIEYIGAGKSTNSDFENKNSSLFVPNKKMFFIFLAVCIIILGFNLSQFPIMKLFSMTSLDEGLAIELGWPIQFLLFDLYIVESNSFEIVFFLLDLLIWLIISYIINILLNLIMQSKFVKSLLEEKEIKNAKPKITNIK
jgi:hypothetical protein